jgi:hypothetical protein
LGISPKAGSHDFLSGDPIELANYFDAAVDIHHVFSAKHCEDQGDDRLRWNGAINKAQLAARTNRIIGGKAPSESLRGLEKNLKVILDRLDQILRSHVIEPELIRRDAFDDFLRTRAGRLLDLIEDATGKPIPGRDSEEATETFGRSLVRL